MKKIAFAAIVSLLGMASVAEAAGCSSPYCQSRGFFGGGRGAMPAFQAAPWYLYWPYNQHFMTPAPMQGAYSAPPMGYGGLSNPYFPAQGGPAGGQAYPSAMPSAPVAPPAAMPQSVPATPVITPAPGRVSIPAVPTITPASVRR